MVETTVKKKITKTHLKIPDEILFNEELNKDIELLPKIYNFEVHKTIWFILNKKPKIVALQLPEGLVIFSGILSDIIEKYCNCETIIMADVVYGACCIDDFTASQFGASVIIHYGHSCLVTIQQTKYASVLYVFCQINIEIDSFVESIKKEFSRTKELAFVTTIQFNTSLQEAVIKLKEFGYKCNISNNAPLSKGEILGCTSPHYLSNVDAIIYLGDGRFHIESVMLSNPSIPAYKYDPYNSAFTREFIDHRKMLSNRESFISSSKIKDGLFGFILGTLGRQGSFDVLNYIKKIANNKVQYIIILTSEITPDFINQFEDSIDVFIQIACPRLSTDWGHSFNKPLLNTYEASVLFEKIKWNNEYYPMDYYSKNSLGPWTPNHDKSMCKNNSCDCKY